MTYADWLSLRGDYKCTAGPIYTTDEILSSQFIRYSSATGEEWAIETENGKYSVILDGQVATALKIG